MNMKKVISEEKYKRRLGEIANGLQNLDAMNFEEGYYPLCRINAKDEETAAWKKIFQKHPVFASAKRFWVHKDIATVAYDNFVAWIPLTAEKTEAYISPKKYKGGFEAELESLRLWEATELCNHNKIVKLCEEASDWFVSVKRISSIFDHICRNSDTFKSHWEKTRGVSSSACKFHLWVSRRFRMKCVNEALNTQRKKTEEVLAEIAEYREMIIEEKKEFLSDPRISELAKLLSECNLFVVVQK